MPPLICPVCSTPAPVGAIYCDECGYDLRMLSTPEPLSTVKSNDNALDKPDLLCPSCGHANRSQAVFCEQCGAQLNAELLPAYRPVINDAQVAPIAPGIDAVENPKSQDSLVSPVELKNPRLVISGTQVVLALQPTKGQIVVGREDPVSAVYPDINLEPYGAQEAGVSRRHLMLITQEDSWLVEDLNTVNGSFLNGRKLMPGQSYLLQNADELRLGKLVLSFYLDN